MSDLPRRTLDDAPDTTSLKRHLWTALFALLAVGLLASGHYAIGAAFAIATVRYAWR